MNGLKLHLAVNWTPIQKCCKGNIMIVNKKVRRGIKIGSLKVAWYHKLINHKSKYFKCWSATNCLNLNSSFLNMSTCYLKTEYWQDWQLHVCHHPANSIIPVYSVVDVSVQLGDQYRSCASRSHCICICIYYTRHTWSTLECDLLWKPFTLLAKIKRLPIYFTCKNTSTLKRVP